LADAFSTNIGWSRVAKKVYFLEQATIVGNAIVGGTTSCSCFVLGLVVCFGCLSSYNHKDTSMVDDLIN
jgi:uncharacterized membrane protein YczE